MHRTISWTRLTTPMRVLLLILAGCAPGTYLAAQTPPAVRVVNSTPIVRWHPMVPSDVLTTVEPGTTLEVLDKEGTWYWVVTPRDASGTRRGGWVPARAVEALREKVSDRTSDADRSGSAATPGTEASIPLSAGTSQPSVTVSSGTEPTSGTVMVLRKDYTFEDVHFARNRAALTTEQTAILDVAANALKADASLRVNIEGYTCNLGATAYNLALGDRRASAVKDYLVSQGVPEDRLRTVSFGEQNPKHDNATEETRRLNRRVAIVPNVQP